MSRDVIGSLAWGVGIVIVALCARFARDQGYMDSETATRVVVSLTGLMVAWFGNQMPKAFVPAAWARQVRRVGGWSMALSGLVYTFLWALAPIPVAIVGGCGIVILGMAVTLAYCFSIRAKLKGSKTDI